MFYSSVKDATEFLEQFPDYPHPIFSILLLYSLVKKQ